MCSVMLLHFLPFINVVASRVRALKCFLIKLLRAQSRFFALPLLKQLSESPFSTLCVTAPPLAFMVSALLRSLGIQNNF